MATSRVVELAAKKVYVLQNALPLDGRISAYPLSARGYSVSNCYLLKEEEGALLLDTGYAAHEAAILAQLESLIPPDAPLSLLPLRLNEFMSVGNAMAIARRFNVADCFSSVPRINEWLAFETTDPTGESGGAPVLLPTTILKPLQRVQIGARQVEVFNAPIRLISTRWIYDEAAHTLFTSDMFSHVWGATAEGPWIREEDTTTHDFVRSFLLNTRYWWLEGAHTRTLRKGIAAVFERYDIETIAPGYGAVLRGRSLVEHQFSVLDEVLARLDRRSCKPQYVALGVER